MSGRKLFLDIRVSSKNRKKRSIHPSGITPGKDVFNCILQNQKKLSFLHVDVKERTKTSKSLAALTVLQSNQPE